MSGAGPRLLRLLLVSVGLLAVAPAVAQERPAPEAPGAADGAPKAADGPRHMLGAGHPLAARPDLDLAQLKGEPFAVVSKAVPAGATISSAAATGSGRRIMPAPPPYGVSSTVRCRSVVKSRRSWTCKSSRPSWRALPIRDSSSGARYSGKIVTTSIFI